MIRLALLALLAAAPALAQENQQAEAQMMRETWGKTDQPSFTIVQPIYNRVLSFKLPRPFVTAFRQQSPAGYIVEYLPDGQTLANWTQMITITSRPGVGAAQVEDDALADFIFNKRSCPGWLYRDLGAVPSPTTARQRVIVLGCDEVQGSDYSKAVPGASERAAIMFVRDGENVWSVQFAQRNLPGQKLPLFDPATAPAVIAKLAIQACAASDTSAECTTARTVSKATKALETK
jgi:hypothetical protein